MVNNKKDLLKGSLCIKVSFVLFCSELRSCVIIEVAVLGSPSLILIIVLMVSVDVKQH